MNQPSGQPADPTFSQRLGYFLKEVEKAYMGGVASDSPLARRMAAQNEGFFADTNPFDESAGPVGAAMSLTEDEVVRLWKEEFHGEAPPEGQAPNLYRMVVATRERIRAERAAESAQRAADNERRTEEFHAKQEKKLDERQERTEEFYRQADEEIARREAAKKQDRPPVEQHPGPAVGTAAAGGREPSAPPAASPRLGAGLFRTDRVGAALSGPLGSHAWNDFPPEPVPDEDAERRRRYQEALAQADLQERVRRAERDGRTLENVKNGFMELVRDASGQALRDSDGRLTTTLTDKGRAQLAKQIREQRARRLEGERRYYGEEYAFDPAGRQERHRTTNAFAEIPYEKEGDLGDVGSPPDLQDLGRRLTELAERQDQEDAAEFAEHVEQVDRQIQRDNPF